MPVRRSVSLVAVSVAASAWAGVMVLSGLWVVFSAPLQWSIPRRDLCDLAGLGFVAGGQLIFMMMVADRIFPRASRTLATILEAGCFAIFLMGLGCASWLAIRGGVR